MKKATVKLTKQERKQGYHVLTDRELKAVKMIKGSINFELLGLDSKKEIERVLAVIINYCQVLKTNAR